MYVNNEYIIIIITVNNINKSHWCYNFQLKKKQSAKMSSVLK